ncbi:SRPBCC domain-containing protein [Chitinophaga sp. CB10]|uniref:SRPBCC family protein n=1 Tax=Chitinophaga sp. CB10 TaxID=1891659 RepID=UPI0025B81673|nr:SRPBCC domain-containing protein [Chitinophaga sp. CB10]
MMNAQNYTASIQVRQSPEEVFRAVTNVRGWWSEQIEGRTDGLDETFHYHYQDVHRSRMKIVEFVPDSKVVWLVEENYFNFTKDASEWTGTRISFDISKKADQTELVFTHIGLVPTEECYNICSDSWGNYIRGSLKALIETGKGNPNPYQAAIDSAGKKKSEQSRSYQVSFLLDKAPATVYRAICEVDQWWCTHFNGASANTGDEFDVTFGDVHYSKHKVVEAVPFKRIIWLVTDSKLSFLKDQQEWTGTKNIFEIDTLEGKTRLTFTHQGLEPEVECYEACTKGWQQFIADSLVPYIQEGKGNPFRG